MSEQVPVDPAARVPDDDAVFGVRESLIVDFAPDETGELAATFDFVLDRA